MECIQTISE